MIPPNHPSAPRKNWPWLILVLAGIGVYLYMTGQLTPFLSKLPSSLAVNTAPGEPHWWEGTWLPADGTAVPWLQLGLSHDGRLAGQLVQDAKAKGYHQSIPILGGEQRPPDCLLFAVETPPIFVESIPIRTANPIQHFLLVKKPGGTAELFALKAPPGELHLTRPGKGAGPIYFPADTEAHQRIAVLTQQRQPATAPIVSAAAPKEDRHE